MSLFGKLEVVDPETISIWSKYRPFACGLCAHVFSVGDKWSLVLANTIPSPARHGNFLACGDCYTAENGDRLALCERRALLEQEVARFQLLGLVDTPEQQLREHRAMMKAEMEAYDAGFSDGRDYRG